MASQSTLASMASQSSTAPGSRTGIPLGSHVCVHLNASLLPTPFLGQSESLQYLPVAKGGIGASQYFHSFSTSGKQEPLSTITLDTHPLPFDFTDQLLQYENWPSADNLLIEATQTAPETNDLYLSLWCPEEAAHLSPDHSITVCNQHAGNSFPVHGASFAPTDYHTQIEGRSVWECSHTHNPGGEHLASLLPQLCTYWPAFLEGVGVQLPNFKEFIEQAYRAVTFAIRPGVAAWRFPPHSLATNTFRLLFSLFSTPGILIEGFGAGTSFSAAAGLIALTRGQFASVLLCLGGVAMHPPTFCKLLRSYTFFYERDLKLHQDFLEEKRPDKKTRPPNYRPLHSAVEPQHGFLIVQHLHDRRAPWALTPLILSHLYNKGISVLTLHDDLATQRAHAEKFGKDFLPRSRGRYRHNYEDLAPTLKTFGASTFFSNFCRPLTWEQLEAREGTLGVSYSPDLLDLFFAFLSYHGTLPLPFFRATPDALEKVLLQGCYRPPGALAGLFHISQEPHETPVNFYTRAFLLPLRFPCLTTLGLPPPDIFAIESAVRQELLRVPLPQALDFLHSQILAILCVNAPRRPKGLKRSTPSTPALPLPAILSSRNGPPLESPIPRNSVAGSHAGWPPTWRSLASNAIPLPGPVLMLTVPAATFLLVLLLVTFSNLPSLQMMSAFLHRKAQRPPISHLLSTSHPPLATKAESAKSSRPNKKIPALPMLLLSMASSSLFCSVTSFGRLHLRAPPLAHFSRLAFLSSLVKIHWRKPSNFHRFLWNIVSTCPSLQLEGFSPSS